MSNKSSNAAMVGFAIVGVVVGSVALIAASCMWSGFVLSIMWKWFVVPFGVPDISIPVAIGLSLTAHMLAGRSRGKDECKALQAWLMVFLGPALTLLFGWFVTLFL